MRRLNHQNADIEILNLKSRIREYPINAEEAQKLAVQKAVLVKAKGELI